MSGRVMRTLRLIVTPMVVNLWLVCAVGAAGDETAKGAITPPRIIDAGAPEFPLSMLLRGVAEGVVIASFCVDEMGVLEDHLIEAYTHEPFARSAEEAIAKWTFEPAKVGDVPVSANFRVRFRFEGQGVVVAKEIGDATHPDGSRDLEPEFRYRALGMRDLDNTPKALHAVAPQFPAELVAPGTRPTVLVRFFIDEQGRVRIPMVQDSENPDLSIYAVEAVRQWRFSPPTRGGKPVLVRAAQKFTFTEPSQPPAQAKE